MSASYYRILDKRGVDWVVSIIPAWVTTSGAAKAEVQAVELHKLGGGHGTNPHCDVVRRGFCTERGLAEDFVNKIVEEKLWLSKN